MELVSKSSHCRDVMTDRNSILTCLITLALCSWTALHLNISEHGGAWKQKWRKAGWLLLGLLAPELIAFKAWTQHDGRPDYTGVWAKDSGFPQAHSSGHEPSGISRVCGSGLGDVIHSKPIQNLSLTVLSSAVR